MKLRCPRPRSGAALQLGPREREHEDRVAARPLEQVLDEVEQARVGPLHVLEDEHRRIAARRAARRRAARRRRAPACRALVARPARAGVRGAARRSSRSSASRTCSLERARAASPARDAGSSSSAIPAAHAHHLGERPVGDAFAVGRGSGRGASRRPPQARRCTCRTPSEPRLADPGDADDRDEMRLAARRRSAWKSSLIERSSRSRPTNGASSPADLSAPPRPATTRSARQSGDRLRLSP